MHPPRGHRLTPLNVFLSFPFVIMYGRLPDHRFTLRPRQAPRPVQPVLFYVRAAGALGVERPWVPLSSPPRADEGELEVEGRLDEESWRDGGLMTGGKVVGDCSVQKTPAAFGQPRAAMLRR